MRSHFQGGGPLVPGSEYAKPWKRIERPRDQGARPPAALDPFADVVGRAPDSVLSAASLRPTTEPLKPCDRQEENTKPSTSHWVWKSTVGSPGTLIFGGSTLITLAAGQWFASAIFATFTGLAVINRMRIFSGSASNTPVTDNSLRAKVTSFLRSPTVDFKGAVGYFLFAAVEAAASGDLICLAYLSFSLGEFLAGRVQARKLARESSLNHQSPVEPEVQRSHRLLNPPIYFAIGNCAVALLHSPETLLFLVPGIAAGFLTMALGLRGDSNSQLPPTGTAFRALALSQALLGLGHLVSLDVRGVLTGVALGLSTPTALMQARDMDRERELAKKALQTKEGHGRK